MSAGAPLAASSPALFAFVGYVGVLAVFFATFVAWCRYGLSFRAVKSRVMGRLLYEKERARMVVLLRHGLAKGYGMALRSLEGELAEGATNKAAKDNNTINTTAEGAPSPSSQLRNRRQRADSLTFMSPTSRANTNNHNTTKCATSSLAAGRDTTPLYLVDGATQCLPTDHPDKALQHLYGYKVILAAQREAMGIERESMKAFALATAAAGAAILSRDDSAAVDGRGKGALDVTASQQKAAADDAVSKAFAKSIARAKRLPNLGVIAEALLSSLPRVRRPIPLWRPATLSDDAYYLTSLGLPKGLLTMILRYYAHHDTGGSEPLTPPSSPPSSSSMPRAFLMIARLGTVYHTLCERRERMVLPPKEKEEREADANAATVVRHSSLAAQYHAALKALWSVSNCPEPFALTGPQWRRLGFTAEDVSPSPVADALTASVRSSSFVGGRATSVNPLLDVRDGGLLALEDYAWFMSQYPQLHEEMQLYTEEQHKATSRLWGGGSAADEKGKSNSGKGRPLKGRQGLEYALFTEVGLVDSYSQARVSFMLSVMLTCTPRELRIDVDTVVDEGNAADASGSDASSSGHDRRPDGEEASSPAVGPKSRHASIAASPLPFQPLPPYSGSCSRADGSSKLRFTPTMVQFLYGGPASIGLVAVLRRARKAVCDDGIPSYVALSKVPTVDDARLVRYRLRQIHMCYMRAYFDLWRREEPLCEQTFMEHTFFKEGSRIADGYLRQVLS